MKSLLTGNLPVLINNFSYGWSNVSVFISGIIPTLGITAIEYSFSAEISNSYGAGNLPLYRSIGNYTFEGSITLYKEEVIALQAAARAQNPLNTEGYLAGILPFDIVVSYAKPDGSGIVTDRLIDCQFIDNKSGSKQNDTTLTTELKLIIGGIQWGI